jgi:hypothetical protein
MQESETGRELSKKHPERLQNIPLVLQYLQAVDEFTRGVMPDDHGYLNILAYAPREDQPRFSVLRHLARYEDGYTGVQDEIDLRNDSPIQQLNAERSADGVYSHYPASLKPETVLFMEQLVASFQELALTEGSLIRINYRSAYTSHHGLWIPVGSGNDKSLSAGSMII